MERHETDDERQNEAGTGTPTDTELTQPRSPTVRGFVYFIRAGKFIKIGFSTRPLDRLKALQTSHPGTLEIIGTREASRDFETELHHEFKKLHVRGEWFRAKHPLLTYIEENTPEGIAAANFRRLEYGPDPEPEPPLSREAQAAVRRLIILRNAHGAETPLGYGYSNVIEQIKAMATYVRPAWATHERQTLPWMMEYQLQRIERLRSELTQPEYPQ